MLKIEREQKTPLIVRESKQAKLPKAATGKKILESLFATMEEQGYGEYFTHRTGHSIGIDCHEFGDVSAANHNEVKPGMIFSVEPGIYISEDIGVRVEDLVLVTEDGCERLNKLTKELVVIK